MLYVCVSCLVVRGCAVSRRYINVCTCDMFSVVNVLIAESESIRNTVRIREI